MDAVPGNPITQNDESDEQQKTNAGTGLFEMKRHPPD
jgi:hypothetical protein